MVRSLEVVQSLLGTPVTEKEKRGELNLQLGKGRLQDDLLQDLSRILQRSMGFTIDHISRQQT